MGNDRDDRDGLAELFEQFFESVSYHGMKRGMARFAKGRAPGQQAPPQADEVDAELERGPTDEEHRLPADERHGRPALASPEGKLPAPLIKRLGRHPKQDPQQRPVEEEVAPEEKRNAEP